MQLPCADLVLDLSRPVVMGILNVTPDSFSDGGKYFSSSSSSTQQSIDLALQRTEQMLKEGASMIDVGGESTRPGAATVSVAEELDRVVPVVEAIRKRFGVIVSVDTSTPDVIRESAAVGAGMINDVRALQRDNALEAAAQTGLPVCLMHMQGQPGTMQKNPRYGDVVDEVKHFLSERITACENAGINKEKILIDPGFGFGKSLDHNLQLLKRLQEFETLNCPILVGMSRKSMIAAILHESGLQESGLQGSVLSESGHYQPKKTIAEERLIGSVSVALLAAERGASIIRVHDVAATREALQILQAITDNSLNN